MTRILFVGQKPETVDFSDPSLPPGFNAEKINAGIVLGVAKIEERGWQCDTCMISPDAAGNAMLESALNTAAYDCVVIGGGGTLLRRQFVDHAAGGSITVPDFQAGGATVSSRSASMGDLIQPGDSRYYLVYYRDPLVLGGCPASSTFNATQTGMVSWSP